MFPMFISVLEFCHGMMGAIALADDAKEATCHSASRWTLMIKLLPFFLSQIQRSASLTWDVRRPGWTTSLCASTWSLMNTSSCHRRLLRPGVSAPTNTLWNTAARTLSTYAFACTPSTSTASIKCCRVLELIGVFCLHPQIGFLPRFCAAYVTLPKLVLTLVSVCLSPSLSCLLPSLMCKEF